MDAALRIALMNVAVAAVAALLAMGAALIRTRPALAHALWLLVILKLLTPPLWGVQIDRRWVHAEPVIQRSHELQAPAPALTLSPAPIASITSPAASVSITPDEIEPPLEDQPEAIPSPAPEVATPPTPTTSTNNLITFLVSSLPLAATLLWSLGSVACGALILVRIGRFHRLLRFATLAPPALQGRATALARRMGMAAARAPHVWFVPGAVSPMLWPLGLSPRVLIPSQLWDDLGEGERSSLLAHELAHLRRCDHWVRLPEVLASVLYWWCPLMWYARRRLREAEEQCCDAWVLWALPDAARDYASALLTTVDFITGGGGGEGARAPLPVLASGMGQFHQLRRRLVMIKQERIPRSLSTPGWLAVSALALGLLPLAPTLAQVEVTPGAPATDARSVSPDLVSAAPAPVAPIPAGVSLPTTPPIAGAPPAIITTAAAPVAAPGAAPGSSDDADASIINDLKSEKLKIWKQEGNKTATVYAGGGDSSLDKAREEARNEVHELSIKLQLAEQRLKDLEIAAGKQMKDEKVTRVPSWTKREALPTPTAPPMPPGAPGYFPPKNNLDPNAANSYLRRGGPMGVGKMPAGDASGSRERRLDAIEANLKALLDEVHAMREKPSDSAPKPKLPAP